MPPLSPSLSELKALFSKRHGLRGNQGIVGNKWSRWRLMSTTVTSSFAPVFRFSGVSAFSSWQRLCFTFWSWTTVLSNRYYGFVFLTTTPAAVFLVFVVVVMVVALVVFMMTLLVVTMVTGLVTWSVAMTALVFVFFCVYGWRWMFSVIFMYWRWALTRYPMRRTPAILQSEVHVFLSTWLKVCLHVTSPCPSPSKFNIVPMVTGTLNRQVGCATHSAFHS